MNCAGLIYDESRHYLDHLAPFCALSGWPLILCEPKIADLARQHYPDLEVVEADRLTLKLPPTVLTCDSLPLLRAVFPGQSPKILWLPHGNSDKGWNTPFFEALKEGTVALVYGQRMIDFMRTKQVFVPTVRVGNFRWRYFQKQAHFYQKSLPLLPSAKKNFLYAPTWDDSENSCSFWNAFPHLAQVLPDSYNLLVKLHPNTLQKFEPELTALMGRYKEKKNIVFLSDAPPIYPLLNFCDTYIGDMSSIGYDFLKFNRPMVFLNSNRNLLLHRCGEAITPETFSFQTEDSFSSIRSMVYDYTFDKDPDWEEVKNYTNYQK